MMISISFFSGQAPALSQPVGPRVISLPNFTLAAEIDPESGEVLLTLTLNGTVAGTFTLTAEQYGADQYNLVPPVIAGTAAVGQTLTVTPGLWLVDAVLSPTMSYQWLADGAPIAGATGTSYVLRTQDAGHSITCAETVGADTVTSNLIALPVALQIARIGDFQSSSTLTASPSFTVDLTGYSAGDRIVFFYGVNAYASAATVGGTAATKLGADPGGSVGGRGAAFSYTLTATGGPGTVIAMTLPNAVNAHVFSCHGIKGGAVSAAWQAYASGALTSTSLAIASNGSHVIGAVYGQTGANPVTWSGVTGIATATLPIAGGYSDFAVAEASGVSAPSLSVSTDSSGSARTAITFVAIQPT